MSKKKKSTPPIVKSVKPIRQLAGSAPKKPRAKKVWQIYRFEQRFEPSKDVQVYRESPLAYTRDFVGSGSDDESIGYQQQMDMLGNKSNHLMLRGAFGELKQIAANRSRSYRGYLLDEKLEPATNRKLADLLGVACKEMTAILKQLHAVGLIEQVEFPEFDPTGEHC